MLKVVASVVRVKLDNGESTMIVSVAVDTFDVLLQRG